MKKRQCPLEKRRAQGKNLVREQAPLVANQCLATVKLYSVEAIPAAILCIVPIAIMSKPENQDRPTDPFEAASYDLNKFRERRLSDRRFTPRGTPDRRVNSAPPQEENPDSIKPSSH